MAGLPDRPAHSHSVTILNAGIAVYGCSHPVMHHVTTSEKKLTWIAIIPARGGQHTCAQHWPVVETIHGELVHAQLQPANFFDAGRHAASHLA